MNPSSDTVPELVEGPGCAFPGTYHSATSILLSVIVPVLSTHSTSTLASVSVLFISCSMTLLRASLTALITRVMLTRRYSPSGIIPMTAATMDVTDSEKAYPVLKLI